MCLFYAYSFFRFILEFLSKMETQKVTLTSNVKQMKIQKLLYLTSITDFVLEILLLKKIVNGLAEYKKNSL